MEVRSLAHSDLPALLELHSQLNPADVPLPEESRIESVWTSIESNPAFVILGGFVSDQLVATCALTIVPNLTRGCSPYGLIENVVTHAAHRRRGYGRKVLEAALAHATAEGCYKVMLLTGRFDEATLRFYRSAGFDQNAKQAFVARFNPA